MRGFLFDMLKNDEYLRPWRKVLVAAWLLSIPRAEWPTEPKGTP